MAIDNIARGLATKNKDAINNQQNTLNNYKADIDNNRKDIDNNKNVLNMMYIFGNIDTWGIHSLTDSTKSFFLDEYKDKTIVFNIGGSLHYSIVTGCLDTNIDFLPISAPTNANVTIGSGEDTEGQVVIECIGDLVGSVGNEYSIEIIAGDTDTGDKIASLTDRVLTIYVDTKSDGGSQDLMAGDVEGLLTTAGIDDKFHVHNDFKPGTLLLDITEDFTGGDDGIIPDEDDKYYIFII